MATAPKFYLTTAIHYTNGPPHIGHAYEMVASDAIARFKRLDGYDVFAMTGTDEHGQKVQRTAAQNGLEPKAYVDQIADRFQEMEERLGCSFDRFIRTTDADHLPSTQELWRRMEANGDIYLAKYAGWYSVRDEAFYGEEETTLLADGTRLGGQGTPVEWVEEESYFFRLKSYQDRLLQLYEDVPNFISPATRKNEIVSFVKGGLEDLSISRTTFDWGLPVPGDERHVMYVWVDALNNYLTGTGFPDPANPRAALLAGRCPHHRQGHRALPHGLLAGLPDVGRPAVAQARLRPWLPALQGREDVEIARQRRRSLRTRRRLWRRPAALFLPARGLVRPGRQLQP
jgi:methionyl-tRNA synthetase